MKRFPRTEIKSFLFLYNYFTITQFYNLNVIAEFLKTWLMKITAILLQQTRTRLSMTPNNPKITDKREKGEKKRERKKG